jgi:hypothetical protein
MHLKKKHEKLHCSPQKNDYNDTLMLSCAQHASEKGLMMQERRRLDTILMRASTSPACLFDLESQCIHLFSVFSSQIINL